MGLSVSISYTTSFPTISGDRAPDLMAGSESTPGMTLFYSTYENLNLGINLQFSYQTDDEVPVSVDITSVTMTCPSGIKYTNSGGNVNISGSITGIFNEKWDFVMKDGSVKRLPINNSEDWIAVVKWYPSSTNEALLSYNFSVKLEDDTTVNMSIPQYIYWRWQPSLNKLKEFVSKGKV